MHACISKRLEISPAKSPFFYNCVGKTLDSMSNKSTIGFKLKVFKLNKDPRVAALLGFSTKIHPRELFPVLQEGTSSMHACALSYVAFNGNA
jgi:hypothetical protein